ncbi:MAG: agmatine/peptidylarginine deiminase, partial [Terriglobia bacterium]
MKRRPAPAALGFRLPAEWEPHQATWLGWPHNRTDWPGKFQAIPWVYGEIVRRLLPGERVRIVVNSAAHQRHAGRLLTRVGVDLGRIEFFRFPTNRGWLRDSGPFFLQREKPREMAVARFRFNAWARYPDWQRDDQVPERIARALRLPVFPARLGNRAIVLEGGATDSNGRGTLLTTEECLLDQTTQARNPGLGRQELEAVFRDYLGAKNVLWLGRGIVGDDTHGHVDDLCRFVSAKTVVLCQEKNPADENHRLLEENRERLEGMQLEDGSRLDVVRLPMPAPLFFERQRLPASYANFYIANAA